MTEQSRHIDNIRSDFDADQHDFDHTDVAILLAKIAELEGLNNALREQNSHLFWLAWQGDYSKADGDLAIRACKENVSTAESAKLFLEELADDAKLEKHATQCSETSTRIWADTRDASAQLAAADALAADVRSNIDDKIGNTLETVQLLAVYDDRRLLYTCHVCEKLVSERESYPGTKGDVCLGCLDREGS